MWLKDQWHKIQAYRAEKFLHNNAPVILDVLRNNPMMAATAVRTMYELEAQGEAPNRTTFSY